MNKRSDSSAPRVRSYFPEALYINPEIITDQNGVASIAIPLADSITTWRMALLASTARGALGSGASSLKVFQDFFVDLDLPVTLTQGDRVSIPVAAYNYSGASGEVKLQLRQDDWFSLVEDVPEKIFVVDSGRVGGSQFTLQAKRIAKPPRRIDGDNRGVEARRRTRKSKRSRNRSLTNSTSAEQNRNRPSGKQSLQAQAPLPSRYAEGQDSRHRDIALPVNGCHRSPRDCSPSSEGRERPPFFSVPPFL